MNRSNDRSDLYARVTQCRKQCDGIINDSRAGLIPRGFFSVDGVTSRPLMLVSKNPGNAPSWERLAYVESAPQSLGTLHLKLAHEMFVGRRGVGSRYHINLIRRVATILGVAPNANAVFQQAVLTALVKCQSSVDRHATLPSSTKVECAETHLFAEIAFFRPVYLLALGNETYDFLTREDISDRHGLKVGKLWHPLSAAVVN